MENIWRKNPVWIHFALVDVNDRKVAKCKDCDTLVSARCQRLKNHRKKKCKAAENNDGSMYGTCFYNYIDRSPPKDPIWRNYCMVDLHDGDVGAKCMVCRVIMLDCSRSSIKRHNERCIEDMDPQYVRENCERVGAPVPPGY